MTVIQFTALPLPHYILSGFSLAAPGRKHPERRAIGEFDLLVVRQGCLYIGEEDRHYEVSAGQAFILRPDLHHYPTKGCRETTASYWLHFHTTGSWCMVDGTDRSLSTGAVQPVDRTFRLPTFALHLPQFVTLVQPAKMYECLDTLNTLQQEAHLDTVRWRQQALFQEVLMLLADAGKNTRPRPGADVADRAASYIHKHYRKRISMRDLGRALHFHPVYIARCMKRQFGCSPMDYVWRYRLEQAKILLNQTDLPIHQVAREVGFQQASYFASCFKKKEDMTPREYRKHFMKG